MERIMALSLIIPITLCLIQGFFAFALPSLPTQTISATGIIKNNVFEFQNIRKHVVAYISFNDSTANFVASNFDLVITDLDTVTTDKIKAINPNITILGYRDIMMMNSYCHDWEEVNSHEDWFLHDIHGNRLININWGSYAMDVGNAGWRSHYTDYVRSKLNNSLFDGIFADDVWDVFIYENKWNVPSQDIPSEIGQRWHNDMLEMIRLVKNAIGEKVLVVNTSNNDDYVNACDGKMEEEFVHPSWYNLDEFHSEYIDWRDKIERLNNLSQSGKYYLAQSGTLILDNLTEAEFDKVHNMMMYCFASYLLGTNGKKASFGFNNIYSKDGSQGYYPEFGVNLGSPLNEYYSINSVYARDFTYGKVLVNPTSFSYVVHLDGEYKTLDNQVVFNITLNSNSGIMLLKT